MDLILLFTAIILTLLLVDFMTKPKSGNILPGRIPIIGHALLFWGHKPHVRMKELSEKYGCVYTVQLFHLNFVVVNGYHPIREVLLSKGNEFGGRYTMFRIDYIYEQRDIVNSDISIKWRRLRKFVHKILKQYSDGMIRVENITNEIAGEFVQYLEGANGEAIDPYGEIYLSVVNVLCSVLTGKQYSKDDEVFQSYLRYEKMGMQYVFSTHNGIELDLFPWIRYLNTDNYKMLKELKILCEEVFNNLKTESVSDGNSSGLTITILQELNNETILEETDIKMALLDILGAGISTSSRSFYILLHILSKHQKVQEKIFEEISEVLAKTGKQNLNFANHREMPYTSASLQEMLRYTSLVPLGLPHKTMVDATIQNVHIPKGNMVLTNLWQLHHDESYWNEPYTYRPERFLDENGELMKADHMNMRRVLAFGAGTRVCVGQKLAQSRIFLLITSVIRRFKIEPHMSDGIENLHDPKNFEFGVMFEPCRGKLKFVKR